MTWFLLLPLWFVFNVLALIVAPILPLFAKDTYGSIDNNNGFGVEPRLPAWLSWLMTFDNSLWGDGAFKALHDGGYWSQVQWLWRNSAYGFERSVLAANIKPSDIPEVKGDPWIADKPEGKQGWCLVLIGSYWNFIWIKKYSETMCCKFEMGWKLKTYAERPDRVLTEPVAQFVVSPRITTFK
ncbi:DUF7338 family protein [Propionivibrio sp.]|uniref:DUF7338 family protein n=1 Tax=Propionivibrio sp. TaxID=2212460 RepID=UPI003BEF5D19